jgi:hypothetical protein
MFRHLGGTDSSICLSSSLDIAQLHFWKKKEAGANSGTNMQQNTQEAAKEGSSNEISL